MKRVTALVPMKAHSERVPGKNARLLAGRPLFHWVLSALKSSRYVSEIVVNTDSEEIAHGARNEFGATVLMRPQELRGDHVPIQPLIAHDLAHTAADWYLQTHSTNPLLRSETIDRAIETLRDSTGYDSLFSVTPRRTRFYAQDGTPVNHDPNVLLRTQDLPPLLEENSCIYVFSRTVFDTCKHRLGKRPLMFSIEPIESIDIDEQHEFDMAEALIRSGSVPWATAEAIRAPR